MKTIESLRQEINCKDREIKQLLDARFALSREVGLYKAEKGIEIFDGLREQAIIEGILSGGFTYGKEISEVYRAVMEQSRNIQARIIKGEK